jgi:hypothetical protein
MQKKTRSLLEELESMYVERDRGHILENRASTAITSVIRVIEKIESSYDEANAEILVRKLLNAIKVKDPSKFIRAVRRIDANLSDNTTKS